jgi:hypothetical protein
MNSHAENGVDVVGRPQFLYIDLLSGTLKHYKSEADGWVNTVSIRVCTRMLACVDVTSREWKMLWPSS